MAWKTVEGDTHLNRDVLDGLSESGNSLLFKGGPISSGSPATVNVSVYKSDLTATEFNYFNVLDNGIVADGVTDNSVKMQQLVNAINALGGGTIYAPKGVYNFLSTVYWKSNVSLIGDGVGLTVLKISGHSTLGHSLFEQVTEETRNMTFSNFTVDGYSVSLDTYTHRAKAFYFQKVYNSVWRDINLEGTGSSALGIDFLHDVHIDNVNCIDCGRLWTVSGGIEGPGGAGIGIGTGVLPLENLTISNCKTYNCGHFGIFLEHQAIFGLGTEKAKGVVIDNCIVAGGRYHGIGIRGGENITVSNCQSYGNAQAGFYIDYNIKKLKISNNTISENGFGVYVNRHSGSSVDELVLNDNIIENNVNEGVKIFKSDYSGAHKTIIVKGNLIKGNKGAVHVSGAVISNFILDETNTLIENVNNSKLLLSRGGAYVALPPQVLEEAYNQIYVKFKAVNYGTLFSRKDTSYTTSSSVRGFTVLLTNAGKLQISGYKTNGGTKYTYLYNEIFTNTDKYYLRITYTSGSVVVERSSDGIIYTALTLDVANSSGTDTDIVAILQDLTNLETQFGREWTGSGKWASFLGTSFIYEIGITTQISPIANRNSYLYYFYNRGFSNKVFETLGSKMHAVSGLGAYQQLDENTAPGT